MNKLKDFLKNDWVITLTATLLGAFLALYLNDWTNERALRKDSKLAKANIYKELENNETNLKESVQSHIRLRDIFRSMSENLKEDGSLVASPKSLNQFRIKYPEILQIKDSTKIDSVMYKYQGEISLDLNLPQITLKTIAWKTFNDSRVSRLYDFECLMYLETAYSLTEEVKEHNKTLFEFFFGEKDTGEQYEKVIKHLNLLIDYEEVHIETLDNYQDTLKDCG
jgi:hypothetical protein